MKKRLMLFTAIIFSLSLFAFVTSKLGSITGQVMPAEAVSTIMLVSGTDTLKVEQLQGVFKFKNLKQGVYNLLIKSNAPYQDFLLKNVAVKDSCTTNVGKIMMQQYLLF